MMRGNFTWSRLRWSPLAPAFLYLEALPELTRKASRLVGGEMSLNNHSFLRNIWPEEEAVVGEGEDKATDNREQSSKGGEGPFLEKKMAEKNHKIQMKVIIITGGTK